MYLLSAAFFITCEKTFYLSLGRGGFGGGFAGGYGGND